MDNEITGELKVTDSLLLISAFQWFSFHPDGSSLGSDWSVKSFIMGNMGIPFST